MPAEDGGVRPDAEHEHGRGIGPNSPGDRLYSITLLFPTISSLIIADKEFILGWFLLLHSQHLFELR